MSVLRSSVSRAPESEWQYLLSSSNGASSLEGVSKEGGDDGYGYGDGDGDDHEMITTNFKTKRRRNGGVNENINSNYKYNIINKFKFSPGIKSILILILLLISFILIITKLLSLINHNDRMINNQIFINKQHKDKYNIHHHNNGKNNILSNKKCFLPMLDIWHKSIEGYFTYNKPMDCSKSLDKKIGKSYSYVKDNKLYFKQEAILNGFLNDGNCCYREIKRVGENDDDLHYSPECINVDKNGITIPVEIIQLECFNSTNKIETKTSTKLAHSKSDNYIIKPYANIHAFIVPKPEEVDVLVRAIKKNLDRDQYYNVLMIGADTLSRLNAHRQFRETIRVLREKFNAIEYYGYNKVGENTFPNLVPLLTGLKPEQLVETKCWLAKNYTNLIERADEFLNDCKFLWNFFQEFGYMTYFSEDWPQASTFNYLKPGFKQEPTAYYGRPITLARQEYIVGRKDYMDCDLCIRDDPIVKLDLTFLKSYLIAYRNNPHFAFQWMNCPQHNDLNGASSIDHYMAQFLNDIHNITYLDRSFLIVYSDHGWRWNDFIGTRIGHYEASLPFMTISPPKKFIEQHRDLYNNLKSHKRTLFTPFDMFKTIIDIRNLARLKTSPDGDLGFPSFYNNMSSLILGFNPMATSTQGTTKTTTTETQKNNETKFIQLPFLDGTNFKQSFETISLLKSIEETNAMNRSCMEAGIPDNFCVCHEFNSQPIDSDDVIAAAYYMVYVHLDSQVLQGEKICARLNLAKIEKAERYDYIDNVSFLERRQRAALSSTQSLESIATSTTTTTTKTTESPTETIPVTTKKVSSTITSKPRNRFKTSTVSVMATAITTSTPNDNLNTTKETTIDEKNYLPKREYNIQVITVPGKGSFQEVVRFYGENMGECMDAARAIKSLIESKDENANSKREAVIKMNDKCKFSIQSESITRLNLYGDQSKCVKSNGELHKVCYCKTLLEKS